MGSQGREHRRSRCRRCRIVAGGASPRAARLPAQPARRYLDEYRQGRTAYRRQYPCCARRIGARKDRCGIDWRRSTRPVHRRSERPLGTGGGSAPTADPRSDQSRGLLYEQLGRLSGIGTRHRKIADDVPGRSRNPDGGAPGPWRTGGRTPYVSARRRRHPICRRPAALYVFRSRNGLRGGLGTAGRARRRSARTLGGGISGIRFFGRCRRLLCADDRREPRRGLRHARRCVARARRARRLYQQQSRSSRRSRS